MNDNDNQNVFEQELRRLEARVEELIQTVERLKQENRTLQAAHSSLATERAQLIERSEMARSRVEAMITRLKTMEQSA